MNVNFLACSLFILVSVCALNAKNYQAPKRTTMAAQRNCKPGPPLQRRPGKINCLIIGDSISIR